MNLLEVYNLKYEKLAILNDRTNSGASNINIEYNLNGVDILTFDLPVTSKKWIYVINENLVKYKNEYYKIKNPTFNHAEDNEKKITVQCKHLSISLQTILTGEIDEISKTASEMMVLLLTNRDTGWTVGNITVDNTKYRQLQIKNQSIFSGLVKVAETFDGMLHFNSSSMTVDLLADYPDRNIQIRKGKNLKSLNIEYNSDDITTRLYPYGGDDEIGMPVDIISINPNGHEYIENYSFYLAQGYTQEYINKHPELFLHEQEWSSTDYCEPQRLYDDAVRKLNTICKPIVKCTLNALDLSGIPEFRMKSPILGEKVYIIDEDFNFKIQAKIINLSRNEENPLDMTIEISNIIEYSNILTQLSDASKKVNENINGLNKTRGSYINGVIDLLQAQLNSTKSGVKTDKDGNLIIENAEKTKALKLAGGMLGIANTKTVAGDYNWRSFGTGDGFTADELVAGVLKGGHVSFDLENGTLLIGNSPTDYKLYFDGTNLRLNDGKIQNKTGESYFDLTNNQFKLGNQLSFDGNNLILNGGKIQSADGLSYFNLGNNQFKLGSQLNFDGSNLVLNGGKIQNTTGDSYFDLSGNKFKLGDKLNFDGTNLTLGSGVTLKAENIDTSTSKIKTAQIENLVVGTNVVMGANASIDWNTQVSGKPTIPSQYTDSQAVQAYKSTYIDASGVYTGTVKAENISGNLISGVRLRTSNTQNYMQLEDQYINFYNGNISQLKIGFGSFLGISFPAIEAPNNLRISSPYVELTGNIGIANSLMINNTTIMQNGSNVFRFPYGGGEIHTSVDGLSFHLPTSDTDSTLVKVFGMSKTSTGCMINGAYTAITNGDGSSTINVVAKFA